MENNSGFERELAELRAADRERADALANRKRMTQRRRGHKGSRVWGYSTGGGKRGQR